MQFEEGRAATLVWLSVVWWWVLGTACAIDPQRGQQHLTLCPLLPAKFLPPVVLSACSVPREAGPSLALGLCLALPCQLRRWVPRGTPPLGKGTRRRQGLQGAGAQPCAAALSVHTACEMAELGRSMAQISAGATFPLSPPACWSP